MVSPFQEKLLNPSTVSALCLRPWFVCLSTLTVQGFMFLAALLLGYLFFFFFAFGLSLSTITP